MTRKGKFNNDKTIVGDIGAHAGPGVLRIGKRVQAAGSNITAVSSPGHHDLLRELGDAECTDYREESFSARTGAFDAVFDVAPSSSFSACRNSLKPKGTYLTTLPGPGPLFWRLVTGLSPAFGGRRCDFVILKPTRELLTALASMLESGAVHSVVSEVLPLQRVRYAHERIQSGHTTGKLVLQMPA